MGSRPASFSLTTPGPLRLYSTTELLRMPPPTWLIEPIIPAGGLVGLYGPPGTCKALALDTPIRTPDGWSTIGTIRPGDYVFGASGRPTRVTGVSPVAVGRPCFAVTFRDGTQIVCDADHLWMVTASGKQCPLCNPPQIRTTQELAQHGVLECAGRQGWTKSKWHVDLACPLEFPTADLPLSPYVLGAWLGDGTSIRGEITSADPEILNHIRVEGWTLTKHRTHKYGYGISGLAPVLRKLGVLGNKHIPALYLSSSIDQRRDLLAGLLDTDGYCDKTGRAIFYNTSEQIVDQVYELAVSLGYKVSVTYQKTSLNGRRCKPCGVVRICAPECPFRLTRKMHRFRPMLDEQYWSIKSIEPVVSVPVKCLMVDADDRLFLVGRNCIPTHNSFLAIDVALSVASTRPWQGHTTAHGPVLYIAAEGSTGITKRVLAWLKTRVVKPGDANVAWLTTGVPVNVDSDDMTRLMDRLMEELPEPPLLVIVDTLARCFDGDENQQEDMGRFIGGIDWMRHEFGSTVMVVHHTRLDGDRERGNTAFRGAADAMLSVKRSGNGTIHVECTKQKDAEEFKGLSFDLVGVPGTDSCIVSTDARKMQKATKTGEILHVLRTQGPLTWDAWLSSTQVARTTFHRAVVELKEKGEIIREKGQWRVREEI